MHTTAPEHLMPAFVDPVHDSQTCFRLLLDATASPGMISSLPFDCQLGKLSPAASQVLLTLADQGTPVWLSEGLQAPATLDNLRFHVGIKLIDAPLSALFAVLTLGDLATFSWPEALEDYLPFACGDTMTPERGTTLVIECTSLDDGPSLILQGPGLREPRGSQCGSLPPQFVRWLCSSWRQHHFPCGVDLIFCAGKQLVALPRTTQVKEA